MKIEDLINEFRHKQKTVNDLSEFIKNRTGNVPNYCLFLGAGCSVTSGVKTGVGLIKSWRVDIFKQLYQKQSDKNSTFKYSDLLNKEEYDETDYEKIVDFLKIHASEWYVPNKEYSSLFEKKFDLPRQRRAFIEKEIRDKKPSIGYAYLTKLMGEKYFNTIFTTNFDDLVNEAFYLFSSDERPIVCAHDSAISSITVSSSRPKVIKLHGDYLFDDIKNTITETESLEVNMKEKFKEFAKDYGLIVMGYSGNDRSIMDILNLLQKDENYYKNGIYWIFRSNSEVNEDLRRLLRHDRVFFIIDDGFDEVMASLYSILISDKHLPIDIETFNKKPTEILHNFLNNENTKCSKSNKIMMDLEKMQEISNTNSSYDILKEIKFLEELKENFDDVPDNLFPILFEIEYLTKRKEYKLVIEKCKNIIEEQDNKKIKKTLYVKMLKCCEILKDKKEALIIINKIHEMNPRDPTCDIYKLPFLDTLDEKILAIDCALVKDEFNESFYYKKSKYLIKQLSSIYETNLRSQKISEVIECLQTGIKRNPAAENPCYFKLYCFVDDKKYLISDSEKNKIRDMIIEKINDQEGLSPSLFKFYLSNLTYTTDEKDKKYFFDKLKTIRDKSPYNNLNFDQIEIEALIALGEYDKAKKRLANISMNMNKTKYYKLYGKKESKLVLLKEGNYLRAAEILSAIDDDDLTLERRIIEYQIKGGALEKGIDRFNSVKKYFDEINVLSIEILIDETNNNLDDAIKKSNILKDIDEEAGVIMLSYLYLKKNCYQEAKQITSDFLEKISFSPLQSTVNINYLLAKKMEKKTGGKNESKLNDLLNFCQTSLSKAAIYALRDDSNNVFENLEKALIHDKSDYYAIVTWPIFEDFRKTPQYKKLNDKFKIDDLKSNIIDNDNYMVISCEMTDQTVIDC